MKRAVPIAILSAIAAAAAASARGVSLWALLAGLAALAGCLAAGRGKPAAQAAAPRAPGYPELRHDIRGILSPAMLAADRLTSHADASVQKAGNTIVRAIEHVTERLERMR